MEHMNVLMTGATGFLGEYLLSELLERGHSVWAIYRNEARRLDTIRFLSGMGLPRNADSLHWVRGDVLELDNLWDDLCRQHPGIEQVDTLLHCAASTRFHMDRYGEPLRTNLGSSKVLSRLVARIPVQVHIISTAYVCGRVQDAIVREVNHPRGDFVNVYEESKWEAEQIWHGRATLLRPSIIVGHSQTTRCNAFTGWYILFQAIHLFERLIRQAGDVNRQRLNINVPADPNAGTNIIPVDHVARAAVELIESSDNHNKIFHLSHPNPPSHQWTLDYICNRFNLGGIQFSEPGAPIFEPRNALERMAWRQMKTIFSHFSNNPLFDRTNTDRALPNLRVPPVTADMVSRLVDYAVDRNWGEDI